MASGEVQTHQMSGRKKMERGSMSISLAQSFVCCAPRLKPAGVASDVAIPTAACPSIGEDCANGSGSSSASCSESEAYRRLAFLLDVLGDCSSYIDWGGAHSNNYSRFVCHTSTLGIAAGCLENQYIAECQVLQLTFLISSVAITCFSNMSILVLLWIRPLSQKARHHPRHHQPRHHCQLCRHHQS